MKLTKLDVRYGDVYASYQGENCVYFFIFCTPSGACVRRPHRGGSDRPCRASRLESAAVTWCLLLSSLTSGTAYCCVEGGLYSQLQIRKMSPKTTKNY